MNKKRLIFEQDSRQLTVEETLYCLSLESNILSNTLHTFRIGMPSIVEMLQSNINSLSENIVNRITPENFFTSKQNRVFKVLSKINYIMLSEIPITIPENFVGKLDEYSHDHYEITENLYVNFNNYVGEFSVILSSFITNKEDRTSSRTNDEFIKQIEKIIKEFNTYRHHYFPKDTGITKSTLNQVIKRPQDFEKMYDSLKKLNTIQGETSLNNVRDKLKHINDLLDIVIKSSLSEEEIKVSSAILENIAKITFKLAKLTEIIAVNYHDSILFVNTVNRITDLILKHE